MNCCRVGFGFSYGFEEVVGGCYVLLEVDVWVCGAYFDFWVCSYMEDEVIMVGFYF